MKNCLLLSLLLCSVLSVQAKITPEQEKLLAQVDSAVAHAPEYLQNRQVRIRSFRVKLSQASNDQERFYLYNSLQKAYEGSNADSSLLYVEKVEKLAQAHQNPEWILDGQLDRTSVYVSFGKMGLAENMFRKLDLSHATVNQKMEYYRLAYMHVMNGINLTKEKTLLDSYYNRSTAICDSAVALGAKDNHLYLLFKMGSAISHHKTKDVVSELETAIRKMDDTYIYKGLYAGFLSIAYKQMGNENKEFEMMALSSIADLIMANHDIGSLNNLSLLVFNLGETERALRWEELCKQWTSDTGTSVGISVQNNLDFMHRQILEQDVQKDQKLKYYLWGMCILTLLVLAFLVYNFIQFRRLHRLNQALKQSHDSETQKNETLRQMNQKLEDASHQLKEQNKLISSQLQELKQAKNLREEYIGSVFNLGSSFISQLEEYRKRLNRQLKVGQVQEAFKQTESNSLEHSCLKLFLNQFDRIILLIYPYFISEFNQLLKPEEQITLKEGEKLNTELRIFALVRLGITDGSKIANFLHCSPQTIYNTRQKVKNKALPEITDFDEAVKNL